MNNCFHVALIVETSRQYGRELLTGIGRYLKARGPWSVYLEERGESDEEPEWLADWKGHGIITRSGNATYSRIAQERGVPAVNLAHHRDLSPGLAMPCINCDHKETGAAIADHFLRRGFDKFGICHLEGATWSQDLREGFVERIEECGHDPRSSSFEVLVEPGNDGDWESGQERLCSWVKGLPKPIGVMAAHDVLGTRVLDACRRGEVSVPKEVAVVGVDNDHLFNTVSWPSLSSVDQNVQKVGFEAARMLNDMMTGKTEVGRRSLTFIPPKELVVRTSSEILAFEDPRLACAMKFIRENADRPIAVDEVAKRTALSRRELERRFRQQLASTPNKEIQHARVSRVIESLMRTDQTLETIAETLDFSEAANMAKLFKKITGMAPGTYRSTYAVA